MNPLLLAKNNSHRTHPPNLLPTTPPFLFSVPNHHHHHPHPRSTRPFIPTPLPSLPIPLPFLLHLALTLPTSPPLYLHLHPSYPFLLLHLTLFTALTIPNPPKTSGEKKKLTFRPSEFYLYMYICIYKKIENNVL